MDPIPPQPEPAPRTAPPEETMELSTRPATEWLRLVEFQIKSLSTRRQELRCKLGAEQEQLRLLHTRSAGPFSVHDARRLAKIEVLGGEWQQAGERVRQARQRVISARRQLRELAAGARARRERSRGWTFWIVHAPRHVWKASPLKRRLREADAQRREALKTIRPLRALLGVTEVRTRIYRVTEELRLKQERLTLGVRSRLETDQKLSATLAPALALSLRLRELDSELVSMKRPTNIALQSVTLPIPVHPLHAHKKAHHKSQGIRPA